MDISTIEFIGERGAASYRSAMGLLARLFAAHAPQTVCQLGCGQGEWLAAAHTLGAGRVVALCDTEAPERPLDRAIEWQRVDLAQPLRHAGRFDLAIALDLPAVVPAARADGLIDDLCWLSDCIVFSAAIPGEEDAGAAARWPSQWSDAFAARGFERFDIFRGFRWADDDIDLHLRQACFLFVKVESAQRRIDLDRLRALQQSPVDVVHPELLALKQRQLAALWSVVEAPSLRLLGALALRWLSLRLGGRRLGTHT